jgi:ATP-binding cassette subfamily B protein
LNAAGYLSPRLRRLARQLPHLARALSLVWTAARGWTVAWLSILLLQGLLPVATVYLTRSAVNALLAAVRAGGSWDTLRPALLLAALIAAVLLLDQVLHGVTGWLRTMQADLVQDHISGIIHEKSIAADLAFYESPEFYDHLHRARAEGGHRPLALIETLGSLLQNGVTLTAMLGVLIPFGPWLPLALLCSTLPALYVVLRHALLQHEWRQRITADERRAWYYDWLLTTGETAAEVRLFGLGPYFRAAFQNVRSRLRNDRLELARAQSRAELAAGVAGLLVSSGAMAWMLWKAVRGLITLGDLAMFYQAFQQGLRLMRTLLENVGSLYQNSLFLGNLFEFLSLEPNIVDPPDPLPVPRPIGEQIRFRGVSFEYPGSRRLALKDFSLEIAAGQMVAIVGPNGAGKSTLLKLLCRLYDPNAGSVEFDGVDLRRMPLADLRRAITVLFQEPVRYNAPAAENIGLGDVESKPPLDAVTSAARAAGADAIISRLPLGYDNMLGKWFESGSELSVGEWQRVALARAFLRQASVIILDEPTSAMDPWAEADWMTRFRKLAAGRTAILITHRFTTAMYADVIHVMDNGRVIESGTHDTLLARNGLYAQGWAAQARNDADCTGSTPVA